MGWCYERGNGNHERDRHDLPLLAVRASVAAAILGAELTGVVARMHPLWARV